MDSEDRARTSAIFDAPYIRLKDQPGADKLYRLTCRSKAGVWRERHEFDRDGACYFCSERDSG